MHPALIKAGMYMKNKYDSITPETKRKAWIIILIIMLLIVFRNRFSGLFTRIFHRDIAKVEVNHNNLTYERSEYYSMCSTLESSMNGSGTQEEPIMTVMTKLKTQDDWNYLQKCFGIRKKDGGTFFSDITGDLKTWLSDDLDEGEMEELQSNLGRSGITY